MDRLGVTLGQNAASSRRELLTLTRINDLLCGEGYGGSYDAVRRYAAQWVQARRRQGDGVVEAFVPLSFAPGDAYQSIFLSCRLGGESQGGRSDSTCTLVRRPAPVTKPLSVDLRERVVAAVDGGLSRRKGGLAVRGEHLERHPLDGAGAPDRRRQAPASWWRQALEADRGVRAGDPGGDDQKADITLAKLRALPAQ